MPSLAGFRRSLLAVCPAFALLAPLPRSSRPPAHSLGRPFAARKLSTVFLPILYRIYTTPPPRLKAGGVLPISKQKELHKVKLLSLTRTSTVTAQIALDASAVHGIDDRSVFPYGLAQENYITMQKVCQEFFLFSLLLYAFHIN